MESSKKVQRSTIDSKKYDDSHEVGHLTFESCKNANLALRHSYAKAVKTIKISLALFGFIFSCCQSVM